MIEFNDGVSAKNPSSVHLKQSLKSFSFYIYSDTEEKGNGSFSQTANVTSGFNEKKVTHSPEGMELVRHFLFDICGVTAGWKTEDVMEEEIKVIKGMVGPHDRVICALSGGVDSTVAA
ncbi:hypothetical protein L1987_40127 [Smallanthus sonchifolius]|uniref:Uncharacterized protein n=1 Tax=Smallanthus sonchifolius TaxID=185202 RepID=A0ACB9GTA4_9ASTR|nr:hypothetical protein L1987_40127 [Smallanthus sonchifolius]